LQKTFAFLVKCRFNNGLQLLSGNLTAFCAVNASIAVKCSLSEKRVSEVLSKFITDFYCFILWGRIEASVRLVLEIKTR